ncbi:hypothetical protein RRG08_039153 [Elysia crispata]|uniref:Uncharacterized protein n=1 Tax=Elysia crispata TaxID=231223 RepID=A0AAE1AG80_9GAST|nr:hypothetical protein RRG08_039153 [Elysia crispata]
MLASKHEISQHTARRRSILTRECRLLIETVLSFTPGLTLDDPGRKAWAVRQRAEPGDHLFQTAEQKNTATDFPAPATTALS